jgi:S1-C subfamily serine protease
MTTGTAFFVTWEGHLVTNHHVVRGASRVQVQLGDGEFADARILAADETNDLALLHVDAIRRPLTLRSAPAVTRGEEVFTLGYPLIALQGQEQKATFGRINASTGMQGDARYAQIDVPIQPGSSGGPLIDRRGEVVGVVTSMLHPRAAMEAAGVVPQNVNYAIKGEYVRAIVERALPSGGGVALGKAAERGGSQRADRAADRPAAGPDYSQLVAEAEKSVVLLRTW